MDVKLWVTLCTQYGIRISRKIITYNKTYKKITVIKTVYCTNTTSPEKSSSNLSQMRTHTKQTKHITKRACIINALRKFINILSKYHEKEIIN